MWEELKAGIIISKVPLQGIVFSEQVINIFQKHQQTPFFSRESGGILIGEIRGSHLSILHATEPTQNDIKMRWYFERRDKKHIVDFESITRINLYATYLGEWHTHSEDFPSPSSIDCEAWKEIRIKIQEPVLFMIIGKKGCYLELNFNHKKTEYITD